MAEMIPYAYPMNRFETFLLGRLYDLTSRSPLWIMNLKDNLYVVEYWIDIFGFPVYEEVILADLLDVLQKRGYNDVMGQIVRDVAPGGRDQGEGEKWLCISITFSYTYMFPFS